MFKSLRSKLVVFFVLVTLIPMSLVGMIGYTSQKQELSNQLEDSMISQSANLSAELLNLINERLMDVEMLTRSPVMRSPDSPPLSIREELYNFLSVNDIYYDAIILNQEGTVLIDTENEMTGRNLADRAWFQEVRDSGLKQMSDIYYSDAIGKPVLVLGAPVYTHDHELLYYVSPSFDLDVFYERIDDYTNQQRKGGMEGYAFLLREDGAVLSHPDQDLVMNVNYFDELGVNADELNEAIHPSGTTLQVNGEVHAFSRTQDIQGFPHRWYVGIALSEEDLYSSLDHLLLRYIGFFAVVFVILIFSVLKLSDYLVRPIQELVERTEAYAEGVEVRQFNKEAYEEADHLHQAFDEMTERIRKREDSHKKSTQVLAATDNGVFAADTETETLTLANRQFKSLFGFENEQVNGRKVKELMGQSPFFQHFCKEISRFHDEAGDFGQEKRQVEISCHDAYGKERIFYLSMTHLTSANPHRHSGKELLVVFQELTEKRRMERELVHSEKLGMVGQMAAGLAHEIRNPMTTIKGFMQLLEQRDNGQNKSHYQVVLSEIDRVNDIMNELMNIGSSDEVDEEELVRTCVSSQLDEILTLHEPVIRDQQIEVETFFSENDEPIVTNGHKLKQVLTNVIRNAIEAMPDGGRLILRAHHESEDRKAAVITVSDTGEGMDEETMRKAGTPFFTTKDTGNGLGLATSFRIVKELGGSIDIDSVKGEGTSFLIRLPDLS